MPDSRRSSDLALATWLDTVVRDRRVLWLGDAAIEVADRLAASARSVLVLAKHPPPKRESQRHAARISALKPGPLSFRPGSFDIIVVPDLAEVELDDDDRIGELRDVVGDEGAIVAATPADDGIGYDRTYELFADRFRRVRMVGQVPFAGRALVDFAAVEEDYDVTFDGSLAGDEQRAERWVVVASSEPLSLDAYCVVQLPSNGAPPPEAPPAELDDRDEGRRTGDEDSLGGRRELEDAIDRHRRDLEAASEHAEALERELSERAKALDGLRDRLKAREEEVASLRRELERQEELRSETRDTEPPPPPDVRAPPDATAGDDVAEDYARLERALAEQGARALDLQREVDRRGTLVRDLVEELRTLRGGGLEPGAEPGVSAEELEAALERAMAAEAARAEAQFQIDELMGRLAAAGAQGGTVALPGLEELSLREAQLEGTVRGLRSRLAEVGEQLELAEGRLAIAHLDVEDQRRISRELEQQIGELREQLELEIVRAHAPHPGAGRADDRLAELRASEIHLSQRVGELSGQLVACRDQALAITEERDHARAENLRLTALISSLEHRYIGARAGWERRVAELEHDGRVAAQTELRALATEVSSLRGERDGLRLRLDDREIALRTAGASSADASNGTLHDEIERLRRDAVDLSARVADAEELARRETDRASELAANAAARDALVTRLQMDLAREETHHKDVVDRAARAEQENERLRGALLDASQQVDEAIASEDRMDYVRRDARAARVALRETRDVLAELAAHLGERVPELQREITAVGVESPEPLVTSRELDLERELADQETLIHSLGAQVEERDDRIRALERRLEGSVGVEGDEEALRRELMELQERAARLSDELLHERRARRAAEGEAKKRTGTSEQEVRELHERLGQSDADLLLLKGQNATSERKLESIREALGQARNGLEELLGAATANGDPGTAERLGNIIRLLNRF